LGALAAEIKSQASVKRPDLSKHKDTGRLPAGGKLDLNALAASGLAELRGNWRLFAALAGVFVLLPNAALQFALPADTALQEPLDALLDAGRSEAVRAKAAEMLGELLAPFVTLAGLATVIAHIGYAAIVALMDRARPTVGEAIVTALKAILPLMLAMLLYLCFGYLLVAGIQMLFIPAGAAGAFLGVVIATLGILFTSAQLALTLPVIVIEREMNPLKALWRSWRLTAASRGNVLGFWMMIAAMWFVSLIVLTMISMVLAGIAGPGGAATLIEGLLTGIFAMVWGTIYCAGAVAMRRELSGPEPGPLAREVE
jgi:hypothetical protein